MGSRVTKIKPAGFVKKLGDLDERLDSSSKKNLGSHAISCLPVTDVNQLYRENRLTDYNSQNKGVKEKVTNPCLSSSVNT